MTKCSKRVTTLLSLMVLVGCGGSELSSLSDPSVFVRAKPVALRDQTVLGKLVQKKKLAVVASAIKIPTAVEFLDWAELAYPELFPVTPVRPKTESYETYLYRYYPGFDWLLAVNQADGSVIGIIQASTQPTWIAIGSLSGFACSVFPSLCGVATPAVFEPSAVAAGTTEVSAFMNVCDPTAPRSAAIKRPSTPITSDVLSRVRDVQAARALVRGNSIASSSYSSDRPVDQLGSCGGRMTYTNYSHSGGMTTATREFQNYCTIDSATGHQQVINGSMGFVNRATPTASGPVTTQFTAQSPSGIAFVTRTTGGQVQTNQTYKFTNYVLTPGVPGGTATPTEPDRIDVEDFTSTNNLTSKVYRQTGFQMNYFETSDGGEQVTMNGRGYRSNGQFYDMSTPVPVLTNSDGDFVSGMLSFAGAAGSTTLATIVPGTRLQTSVTIDGKNVPGLPSCSN